MTKEPLSCLLIRLLTPNQPKSQRDLPGKCPLKPVARQRPRGKIPPRALQCRRSKLRRLRPALRLPTMPRRLRLPLAIRRPKRRRLSTIWRGTPCRNPGRLHPCRKPIPPDRPRLLPVSGLPRRPQPGSMWHSQTGSRRRKCCSASCLDWRLGLSGAS